MGILKVNDSMPKWIFYNNEQVKELYFNNELVYTNYLSLFSYTGEYVVDGDLAGDFEISFLTSGTFKILREFEYPSLFEAFIVAGGMPGGDGDGTGGKGGAGGGYNTITHIGFLHNVEYEFKIGNSGESTYIYANAGYKYEVASGDGAPGGSYISAQLRGTDGKIGVGKFNSASSDADRLFGGGGGGGGRRAGGNGQSGGGDGGNGLTSDNLNGKPGAANTGGGGGGGGWTKTGSVTEVGKGGAGGSGIVILRNRRS